MKHGHLKLSATNPQPLQAPGLDAVHWGQQLDASPADLAIERNGICRAACSTDTFRGRSTGVKPRSSRAPTAARSRVRVWNGDGLGASTSTSDLSKRAWARRPAGAKEAQRLWQRQRTTPAFHLAGAALEPLDNRFQEPPGHSQLLTHAQRRRERDCLVRHAAITTVSVQRLAPARTSGSTSQRRRLPPTALSTAASTLRQGPTEAGRKPRSRRCRAPGLWRKRTHIAGCIDEAAEAHHLRTRPNARLHGLLTPCVFSPESVSLDLFGAFKQSVQRPGVLDGVSLSHRESLGDSLAVPFLSIHDKRPAPGQHRCLQL